MWVLGSAAKQQRPSRGRRLPQLASGFLPPLFAKIENDSAGFCRKIHLFHGFNLGVPPNFLRLTLGFPLKFCNLCAAPPASVAAARRRAKPLGCQSFPRKMQNFRGNPYDAPPLAEAAARRQAKPLGCQSYPRKLKNFIGNP